MLAHMIAGSSPSAAACNPRFAAARRGKDGAYSAAVVTRDGRDIASVALPARGHDIAVSPLTQRCVVFARRPGNFAVAFSANRASPPISFATPPDRHFYGHGVFSTDGRLLYATENDFENGRGAIGVYDATNAFARIGEFDSGGIGPHDIALLPSQPVLVVANGGLREHPDFGGGRRVLNPEAIETSLAYVDLGTGDLIERHALPREAMMSLRHLGIARDGTVIIGGQGQGADGRTTALIYRHLRQQPLLSLSLLEGVEQMLQGYVSSVAVDTSGTIAAVTSSHGGSILVIEIASGRVIATRRVDDVSGIAPHGGAGSFVATSGLGLVGTMSALTANMAAKVATDWVWDNHATSFCATNR